MSRPGTVEKRMLRDLLRRKREYEAYFDKHEGMDNAAQSAYTSLVKAIVMLARKSAATAAKSPEESMREAERILREEYGVEL